MLALARDASDLRTTADFVLKCATLVQLSAPVLADALIDEAASLLRLAAALDVNDKSAARKA